MVVQLERKTAAGIPATVQIMAKGMLPQPPIKAATGDPMAVKRSDHGAVRTRGRFILLSTLRDEQQ